jgi:hypothetical protein
MSNSEDIPNSQTVTNNQPVTLSSYEKVCILKQLLKEPIDTRKKAIKIIELLCGKHYDGTIKKRKGTYWYISVDDDGRVYENSVFDAADNYIDDVREALEVEAAEEEIERENAIYDDDVDERIVIGFDIYDNVYEVVVPMDPTDDEMA